MLTNEQLTQHLINSGVLKTPRIIEAFKKIDRKDFVREDYLHEAYKDYPLSISQGQTISQPSTVAFMLELLQPKLGDKILDVGSGSGWTTALLAEIVGPQGKVWATEIIEELIEFGNNNLQKYDFVNAEILPAESRLGLFKRSPFDKILVSAAGRDLPQELVNQLKISGRMVIPIYDAIWKIDKISKNEIKQERYSGFAFVPLVY